ncbi:MAG: GTPase Era [Rickettsiales bacterium]
MSKTTRCGVIAIVGEPNAGKSTLINHLTGGKVSIVTPKAQTTRFNIRGVCVYENTQFIYVDTPGIFDTDKNFESAMVNAAWAGVGDADAVLMLLDGQKGLKDGSQTIIEQLKKVKGKPVFLAINKVDKIKKPELLKLIEACDAFGVFDSIFMISALKGDGIEHIMPMLAGAMPEGPWHYPEEQMSDISMRLLAAEITREKLFMLLDQELPYSILVETEKWEETDKRLAVSQAIYVQREGQKKIVIGEKGAMIKRIGSSARRSLEELVGRKLHLELFVKVKPNWKEDSDSYRMLGLEYKK